MSQEAIEIIRQLDMRKIENQFVFQCAPLIAGLRISNLFIIRKNSLRRLCSLLQMGGIRCRLLFQEEDRLTVLLYHASMLSVYLRGKRARNLLIREGYEEFGVNAVLCLFTRRYRQYREGRQPFPHELGLLLGYPLEDVEGFIQNEGKNCLYTGYWKVYANVPAKRHLFRKYESAREDLMKQICQGTEVEQVLRKGRYLVFTNP